MSKTRKIMMASLGVLFAAWTYSAQAGLDGATVNVSTYYPTSSSLFESGANVVVSAAVEYPAGSFPSYDPTLSIDITDTQLIITAPVGVSFDHASFNGFLLTIISGPSIVSAVADSSSQYNPVGISIVGGDQLYLNYEGVDFVGLGSSIIDINSGNSVPDGGLTVAMLGMAMTGLSLIRRKF